MSNYCILIIISLKIAKLLILLTLVILINQTLHIFKVQLTSTTYMYYQKSFNERKAWTINVVKIVIKVS